MSGERLNQRQKRFVEEYLVCGGIFTSSSPSGEEAA